jgi:hypothetical protein
MVEAPYGSKYPEKLVKILVMSIGDIDVSRGRQAFFGIFKYSETLKDISKKQEQLDYVDEFK